ncbi:hypothetical protein EBQ34_03135 [Vandammella animalimorsus]|uniref:Uncharacterized protein n=2 Tax=Vandammella animalimorsus TaxID=2029117 RepID=A0A3M6RS82_9BURK|nr:hypothetical protein [Vandammella animalimorsus]RMX18070.1 hypothetical protein EBQ34_03135 [Vandammella animalimorsus]
MPILAGDVKLVASQVMDDVAEGGGAPTANVIVDGASNSLFNDISELDRAGGRVNLRKVFASIQTDTTDTYLGGNVIVSDPPSDPRVAVTIFSTQEVFDRRTQARDRIEAYLNKGSQWNGYLLENHIAGQRSIQLFQRVGAELPTIGKTLFLVMNEGLPNEYAQYVRITRIESETRTFSYGTGSGIQDYQAVVVSCELSDALRYDFPGSPPDRLFTMANGKTRTRDTVVADAAKYCGVVKTTQPVAIGDVAASVSSVFTQLVPSAQTETPLLDLTAGGTSETLIESDNGTVSYTTAAAFNASTVLSVGNAIQPGTLSISVSGATLTDNGGDLVSGATVVGTVNYGRGQITLASSAPTYSGTKTISFRPAAAPIRVADTAGVRVDIESRSYNYILTIVPSPAPGTLQVSYRAQGKWYDLRDNGAGVLKGVSPEYGVGTVSYTTGTVAVTLGALPDVGSEIVYAWGGKANYFNRASSVIVPPSVALQLTHAGVTPGSVMITWNDGAARSATDDGKGTISGHASGTINYQTGLIQITPTVLPAGGQTYSVAYTWGPPNEEEFEAPLRNGDGSIDVEVDFDGLIPGTVELEWNLLIDLYEYISTTPAELQLIARIDPIKIVKDDGLGVLRDPQGMAFGTVNYATGVVHFTPDTTVRIPVARYNVTQIGWTRTDGRVLPVYRNLFSHWEYIPAGASMPIDDTGWAKVRYRAAGASSAANDSFTAGALVIDLTPTFAENIVPGSICFTLGGKTYFDRLGSLYYDLDPVTGAATLAGQINYANGAANITAWVPAAANAVALRSLLTTLDGTPVDEVTFRVPASPVRPSSLQLLATRLSGGTINVSANNNGDITGTDVIGSIDYETGVVRVRFGAWVAAAGNEGQSWYDPDAVVTIEGVAKIFKPVPVFADTIKYNAVAYSYLPLDADIIGLDPVRLPQDGRVPIFRAGDFAVIGHTATVGPFTATSGQVVDCGRQRLSRVRVLDGNGEVVTTDYTADLEAGTVTFGVVTGLVQPVTVEHRIEDMAQVSDVQISGRLTFTRQITHDYPVGSHVSSALVSGDLRAYVSNLFDQASWNGSFLDAINGAAATATYNDVLAPIVVTNAGAITERWAIQFTNATSFNVIGEHVGVIATGTTGSDIAPTNPATGKPYFTLAAVGWGSGWATGNVLRFNTTGALFPVWVVRTIQQGPETVTNDAFTLLVRGDVDRP